MSVFLARFITTCGRNVANEGNDGREQQEGPIKDLKTEDGADDLVHSAMMRPYVRLAEAILTQLAPQVIAS